jgi:hypothetical protein
LALLQVGKDSCNQLARFPSHLKRERQIMKVKSQELNADIATELVDKAALKEALAIPADQLEVELIAEGVDLEGGARRFREMLANLKQAES